MVNSFDFIINDNDQIFIEVPYYEFTEKVNNEVFIKEVKAFSPDTEVVETKVALGRNKAKFNDNQTVLNNIYSGVLRSLKKDIKPAKIPTPCNVEIRYTRTERATEVIAIQKKDFNRDFTYGEDAHIIKGYCENITDIKHCLLT